MLQTETSLNTWCFKILSPAYIWRRDWIKKNVDLQLRNQILILKWNSCKKYPSQFELLFGSPAVDIAAFLWRSAFWGAANNLHECPVFVIHNKHVLQFPDMHKGWCWSGGRLLARTDCTEPFFCPAQGCGPHVQKSPSLVVPVLPQAPV